MPAVSGALKSGLDRVAITSAIKDCGHCESRVGTAGGVRPAVGCLRAADVPVLLELASHL
jgi:hypothetical protein